MRKKHKKGKDIKYVPDMYDHFKNIFDEREREQGVPIEIFLGEIKNNPETLAKKLTDMEREANVPQ